MAYVKPVVRVVLTLLTVPLVSAQDTRNVLTDVCLRYGHQTAVIDRKLYIDGGWLYWTSKPPSLGTTPEISTKLIYGDLNSTTQQMPTLHADSKKDSSVPSVAGGILWADEVNKVFWLYGGESPAAGRTSFDLWGYDTILNQWNRSDAASKSSYIGRVSYGAGATLNRWGYYYGGYLNSDNTPGWSGAPLPTSNLIVLDMDSGTLTNNTGPPDRIGRAEGVMVAIPASAGGMLVYFGGVSFPYGNSTEVPMDMSSIILYDRADNRWYKQTATGDIPPSRRKFCAGVTWDTQQSSYNIYLYGGLGFGANTSGFDDVYILTMPTFQWIKWYPDISTQPHPKAFMSCNVVGKGQMIVMGGNYTNYTDCDVAGIGGQHNMALSQNNVDSAKWYQYLPNVTDYTVPKDIIAVAGANKAPARGWDDSALGVYFNQKASFDARTPTRYIPAATATASNPTNGSSGKFSTGAIAGVAVGGAVALLVAALLIWWFCIKKRQGRKQRGQVTHGTSQTQIVPPELNGDPNRYSNNPTALVHAPGSPNHPPHHGSYSASSSPPPQQMMYPQNMPVAQPYFPPQMQQQGYGPQPLYQQQFQQPQYPGHIYPQQHPQQHPQPFFPPPPENQRMPRPVQEMPVRGMTPGTYHVQQPLYDMQQPAPQRVTNYGNESMSGQSGDHQRLDSRSQSTTSPMNSTWQS